MPDAPESDSWTALPPSPVTALVHAEAACSSATLGEAVQLIYAHDAPEQAWALAQRCTQEARQQGHAVKRLIAVRIQALIAMRFRDLETLQAAGQALIEQRVLPEYVPDGHMCLAFTCLAQGDTQCARTHLTQARAQFTALQIPHALDHWCLWSRPCCTWRPPTPPPDQPSTAVRTPWGRPHRGSSLSGMG